VIGGLVIGGMVIGGLVIGDWWGFVSTNIPITNIPITNTKSVLRRIGVHFLCSNCPSMSVQFHRLKVRDLRREICALRTA
jgi:hypothetical protein